jgi:hypothetical protein
MYLLPMNEEIRAVFAGIRASDVNLVRLKRDPAPALRAAAVRAVATDAPDLDCRTPVADIERDLTARGVAPALAADMALLGLGLAEVANACTLRLRLERVTGPACKLFHVDYVECRLIVTYAGAGTEYLADADVRRERLAQGSNRGVVKPGADVRHLDAFEVGLFKGEAWPGNRGKGIVHRSPPASHAKPRLVFVADALCAHES